MSTLERLRQLEQEATPGEWEVDVSACSCGAIHRKAIIASNDYNVAVNVPLATNRALIAAMRNALPGLLRVAEAAEWFVRAQDDVDMVDEVKAFIELQASLRALDGEGSGDDE